MGIQGSSLTPAPIPPLYTCNVSAIQDFMQCRYRWACKWVYNRTPRAEPKALTFGKLLHLVFEDHLLSSDPMDKVIDRQIAEYKTQMLVNKLDLVEAGAAASAIEELEKYKEVLCLWQDKYPFDVPVLEVEQPFEMEMGNDIAIKGKPDRVGVVFGRTFHVQNRSLAGTTNFEIYSHLAKRHLHELVYGYWLRSKYPAYLYGGTIFNLLRKVAYRNKAGTTKPIEHMLWQGMVNFSDKELNEGWDRAYHWICEMRMEHTQILMYSNYMPLPNEKMNGGPYGNLIDPYFLVLEGEISLDDDKWFKQREETYTT